jgi:hypothetical protein
MILQQKSKTIRTGWLKHPIGKNNDKT